MADTDPVAEAARMANESKTHISDHYVQETALFYVGLQLGRIADALEEQG